MSARFKLANIIGMSNLSELDLLNSSESQLGEADSQNIMEYVVYGLNKFVVPIILLVGLIGKLHFTPFYHKPNQLLLKYFAKYWFFINLFWLNCLQNTVVLPLIQL